MATVADFSTDFAWTYPPAKEPMAVWLMTEYSGTWHLSDGDAAIEG
jgi:hypothetical protein